MFVFQMPNINHFRMRTKNPPFIENWLWIYKKKSKAILRKIILLKSKILLEWGNCLNSPSDKCHSCLMQKQQPEKHLPQEGNQDPFVSSLGQDLTAERHSTFHVESW